MNFDELKDELLAVTDTGLKYAKSLDNTIEFEIFVFYQNKINAEISQGIVTAKDGAVAGTAVRANSWIQSPMPPSASLSWNVSRGSCLKS